MKASVAPSSSQSAIPAEVDLPPKRKPSSMLDGARSFRVEDRCAVQPCAWSLGPRSERCRGPVGLRYRRGARRGVGRRELGATRADSGRAAFRSRIASPRPRAAAAEEGGAVLEDARRRRGEPVGARPHPLERGRLDQSRPSSASGTSMPSRSASRRISPSRSVEQVVVVRPARRWARPAAPTRRSGATSRRAASPAASCGSPSPLDPSPQPLVERAAGRRLAGRLGAARQLAPSAPGRGCRPGGRATPPCRAGGGPPRCTSPGVERQPVERGVGLDEPPVLLGRRAGRRPRRVGSTSQSSHGDSSRQRRRQVRCLEHEQRADHLHPRGAALGPGADDDVAGRNGNPSQRALSSSADR